MFQNCFIVIKPMLLNPNATVSVKLIGSGNKNFSALARIPLIFNRIFI